MPTALQSVAHTLMRVLVVVAGAVLAMLALAMGLLLGLGLMVWALLRGRKPVLQQSFHWPRRGGMGGGGSDVADVVDIEAREVRDTPPPRLPDR